MRTFFQTTIPDSIIESGKIDGAYVEWDVAASYQQNYSDLVIVCEVPYEAEGNVIGVKKGNARLELQIDEPYNVYDNFIEELVAGIKNVFTVLVMEIKSLLS